MKFSITRLETTASTQNALMECAEKENLPEGSVFICKNQYAGKGQGTNKWESKDGENLTFSLLLKPSFLPISHQFDLMQALSLAIKDFVGEYVGNKVRIKWPNDIYVGKDKICGCLLQYKVVGNTADTAYCGIGININQEKFSFAPNPTSLYLQTGRKYDLEKLFDELLQDVARRYDELRSGEIGKIKAEYLEYLLYKDITAEYIYKGKTIKAAIKDVDSYGHLILRQDNGEMLNVELKELVFTHREA